MRIGLTLKTRPFEEKLKDSGISIISDKKTTMSETDSRSMPPHAYQAVNASATMQLCVPVVLLHRVADAPSRLDEDSDHLILNN